MYISLSLYFRSRWTFVLSLGYYSQCFSWSHHNILMQLHRIATLPESMNHTDLVSLQQYRTSHSPLMTMEDLNIKPIEHMVAKISTQYSRNSLPPNIGQESLLRFILQDKASDSVSLQLWKEFEKNLDVLRICKHHGQPIYTHAPACCRRQPVLPSSTEGTEWESKQLWDLALLLEIKNCTIAP
jgi:hypothetical protein